MSPLRLIREIFKSLRPLKSRRACRRADFLGSAGALEQRVLLVAFSEFVDPNPAPGNQFGHSVVPLSTGNVVITSPYDDAGGTDAGAVYLYNGSTGELISTLRGSHAGDRIGLTSSSDGAVLPLSNGNYVVRSEYWDNGSAVDAGAVTWGNGVTGVIGVVSAANSLVGSSSGDSVGKQVTTLSNGNYVVRSPYWDNGALVNVGAVTWGSGTTGISGVVSAANSLVGSSSGDSVGSYDVTVLRNGNYVVSSPYWDNGSAVDAGAVTWGNGTTGISGVVSAANSLFGSSQGDNVGIGGLSGGGVMPLRNGNYVVTSPNWNNGAVQDAGAVTWGNGTTGIVGVVSTANSLVGSSVDDRVGNIGVTAGVTALSNGNYVVRSPWWDNGVVADAGAVTWGNGTTGVSGVVSSANSLVGSFANDAIGNRGMTALSNGNYVVSSPFWDNGAVADAGAVTWGNGTTGVSGVVSSANSLVGSFVNDGIGGSGVMALSNGNYVVSSKNWDNGAVADAGAVTWGNGAIGVRGVVSSANSLVGSFANDAIGNSGVTALSNGNYVVRSPWWDNGVVADAGAVTWGDGTTGVSGAVSSANSLVGSFANDRVGFGSIVALDGVIALSTGNYVVCSSRWNANKGAVTWGNGSIGVSGVVSSANSLVGSSDYNNVGSDGLVALSNGNYVVRSSSWDNEAIGEAGAVTWGSGTTGVSGVVNSLNSLVGSSANDKVGTGGVTALSNGNYVVISPYWNNGAVIDPGAVTWGSGTTGVSGAVSASNSLVGLMSNTNSARLLPVIMDPFNGTYMACFLYEGGGRVRVGSQAGPVTGAVSFTINGSVLNVLGTSSDDTITVRNVAGVIKIDANGTLINTGLSAASVTAVSISGLAGNDVLKMDRSLGALVSGTLLGGSGNDTLISGLGNDTLDGGADVDTVSYVQAGVGVRVNLASTAVQTTGGAGSDKLLGIENLTGSSFSDSLTGSAGGNILRGGAGNDTLTGGAGADFLVGEAGNDRLAMDSLDTVNGGTDLDTVTVGAGAGNVNLNLFSASIEFVSASVSTGNNTFNATGATWPVSITSGSGNDTIIGGSSNDRLTGGAGNDSIVGGGGNDTITGGLGADNLRGEAGSDYLVVDSLDTVNGGADLDTVSVGAGTGNVNFNLFSGEIETVVATASTGNNTFNATGATWAVTITGGLGNDTITGGNMNDRLTGGAGNDSIIGNSGNDTITGSQGSDNLSGGAGNDTLSIDSLDSVKGGADIDTVSIGSGTGNVTLNLFTGEIETVTATASTGNNTFNATGATWPVSITGGSGNDTVIGGNMNDRLTGGAGNDSIIGNSGNDTITGGDGIDTVSYQTATGPVTVNLTTRKTSSAAGIDTLATIENVIGSLFADTITGDLLNNILNGGDGIIGNDTIIGGGGVDSILNA